MKHLSIRVAWQDNYWDSCYCAMPSLNSFCKTLPRIAMSYKCRDDDMAEKFWGNLNRFHLPPCVGENGGFMNKRPYGRVFEHVYSNKGGIHSVLKPTEINIPEFTAYGIPYRYLTTNNSEYVESLIPEIHTDVTPDFSSSWVYSDLRQRDILSWFRSNLSTENSLCVFYCKNGNPVDDQSERMIVGLGEINRLHPIYNYETSSSYTYPLWEVLIEHSIRRDLKDSKGFLIPYHQYLQFDEKDIKRITGLSKEEALDEIKLTLDKVGNRGRVQDELSYGCDYVSNTSMLMILIAARNSVEAIIRHRLVGGDWSRQLRWINNEIGKIKSMIVPFPSFAEALSAIGINYSYLIELDLRKAGCGNKDNPWDFFEKLLRDELNIDEVSYFRELSHYRETWNSQSENTKEFLKLVSRFEINADIIYELLKRKGDYLEIIANPYKISEEFVKDEDYSVTTDTIDLGVMVDPDIQGECIPQFPSAVESVIDKRRLRSIVIEELSQALEDGDTLVSIQEMEDRLRYRLKEENSELPIDILLTVREFFSEEIVYLPESNPNAIQLKEYYEMERKIESILRKRALREVKNIFDEDWIGIVKGHANYDSSNERSVIAAKDQALALEMMNRKRLSVLAGGAGTGKTAVVSSFLASETIRNEGVLLLAPTGKARVRLSKEANGDKRIEAKTIAQFLMSNQRYDPERMRTVAKPGMKKYSQARNIIIDECSMLTTRDFYVLLDALDLGRINRIILIGDPNQLPPIGSGRPFADLYHYLDKKVTSDYEKSLNDSITCLKTVVRTVNGKDSDILTLASWFSNEKPRKESEDIFDKIENNRLENDLKVYTWQDESDLIEKLQESLCEELKCDSKNLGVAIKRFIGTDDLSSLKSTPEKIEKLQILTPVLHPAWGVYPLNERIQKLIRNDKTSEEVQFSTQKIHIGDKVMQLMNQKLIGFPSKITHQLSNGQIGFVESIYSQYCNVTYSGIANDTFGFVSQKSDDGNNPIELAYAITIHKSQGSDFEVVVVILPKSGKIISRELIYTALTRAKGKVILLVEDNVQWLYEKSKPESSVLAQRNTNLFSYSVRSNKSDIPYVEGLIHRSKPDMNGKIYTVRSKSEVIIVNELISSGLEFKYEERLDGENKFLPDFTFVDDGGETIIWEHLGMLNVPEYKKAWDRKLCAYKKMGFIEGETLFITEDHPDGSIDTNDVVKVINQIKGIME